MNQRSLYLHGYVDRLQESGRYTFVRDDALKELKISPVALKLAARRLSRQARLISPRRGFYVIVPLEYKSAGSPPPSWFIDQLMPGTTLFNLSLGMPVYETVNPAVLD